MSNLTSVLSQLEQERSRLQSQLNSIQNAVAALSEKTASPTRGGMSAAGRAKIAAAQRARWAKVKGQKSASGSTAKRRRMSPAAIARIRAAQKARWAKWRKRQKGS
jgi:hypothetical protein